MSARPPDPHSQPASRRRPACRDRRAPFAGAILDRVRDRARTSGALAPHSTTPTGSRSTAGRFARPKRRRMSPRNSPPCSTPRPADGNGKSGSDAPAQSDRIPLDP
jgi:hypothetical protein